MQVPAAPCGAGHPCAGEGAATTTAAFGVRASISGAAVPKQCWTSPGCAGCCSITACLWIELSWLHGQKEQGWGRAGWRGGGAVEARSSKRRKHSTAPSVRQQRVARGRDGCTGAAAGQGDMSIAQGSSETGKGRTGLRAWHAGAKLLLLLCLKPEPCLVPLLVLLPEG